MHPWFAIALGFVAVWLLYTLILFCWVQTSHLGNNWRFAGHAPTDALTATINGQSTRVIATNSGQQISVYIFLGNDKVQILSEPLSVATWGSNTNEVVPSFSVDHGRIMLRLTGDPQYGNFVSPVLAETFAILPTTVGDYQIERTA